MLISLRNLSHNKQPTMKSIIPILAMLCFSLQVLAQPAERRISRQAYIDMWKHEAQHQMMVNRIPASITLAQGILESASGNSSLAKYANNHFGIKCHDWKGASFVHDDDKKNECFRKYETSNESFEDHSKFLTGRSRYAFLFEYKVTDYKSWAHGLKKAGYATNPKYAYLLIDIIEQHELYQYDQIDMASKPKAPKVIVSDDEITIHTGHNIKFKDNGVKFIVASTGDTFYKIAKEFDLSLSQLYKYNDLGKDATLHAGEVIYVAPKKAKAKTEKHIVKSGETLWSISQIYGIKLKKLYKKNNLTNEDEVKAGDLIHLKKRKR